MSAPREEFAPGWRHRIRRDRPRVFLARLIAAVAVAAIALAVARGRTGGVPSRMAEALTDMGLLACLIVIPLLFIAALSTRRRRGRTDGTTREL